MGPALWCVRVSGSPRRPCAPTRVRAHSSPVQPRQDGARAHPPKTHRRPAGVRPRTPMDAAAAALRYEAGALSAPVSAIKRVVGIRGGRSVCACVCVRECLRKVQARAGGHATAGTTDKCARARGSAKKMPISHSANAPFPSRTPHRLHPSPAPRPPPAHRTPIHHHVRVRVHREDGAGRQGRGGRQRGRQGPPGRAPVLPGEKRESGGVGGGGGAEGASRASPSSCTCRQRRPGRRAGGRAGWGRPPLLFTSACAGGAGRCARPP